MKKLTFIFVFIVFGFLSTVFADLIMPNTHLVNKCVKINNLSEYSDLKIVEYVNGPTERGIFDIEISNCVPFNHYKFAEVDYYFVKKSYIDSVGGVENLPTTTVEITETGQDRPYKLTTINTGINVSKIKYALNPRSYYITDENSKIYDEEILEIIETNEGYDLEKVGENSQNNFSGGMNELEENFKWISNFSNVFGKNYVNFNSGAFVTKIQMYEVFTDFLVFVFKKEIGIEYDINFLEILKVGLIEEIKYLKEIGDKSKIKLYENIIKKLNGKGCYFTDTKKLTKNQIESLRAFCAMGFFKSVKGKFYPNNKMTKLDAFVFLGKNKDRDIGEKVKTDQQYLSYLQKKYSKELKSVRDGTKKDLKKNITKEEFIKIFFLIFENSIDSLENK